MDPNYIKLREKVTPLKGTLVLYGGEVVKLEGCSFDNEDNYYNLTKFSGEKLIVSAVLSVIFLKEELRPESYQSLVHFWNLNKEQEFENSKVK